MERNAAIGGRGGWRSLLAGVRCIARRCRIFSELGGTLVSSAPDISQMFKKIIGGTHAFKKGNKFTVVLGHGMPLD